MKKLCPVCGGAGKEPRTQVARLSGTSGPSVAIPGVMGWGPPKNLEENLQGILSHRPLYTQAANLRDPILEIGAAAKRGKLAYEAALAKAITAAKNAGVGHPGDRDSKQDVTVLLEAIQAGKTDLRREPRLYIRGSSKMQDGLGDKVAYKD